MSEEASLCLDIVRQQQTDCSSTWVSPPCHFAAARKRGWQQHNMGLAATTVGLLSLGGSRPASAGVRAHRLTDCLPPPACKVHCSTDARRCSFGTLLRAGGGGFGGGHPPACACQASGGSCTAPDTAKRGNEKLLITHETCRNQSAGQCSLKEVDCFNLCSKKVIFKFEFYVDVIRECKETVV